MSFIDCIQRAMASGEIDEETAGAAQGWYERHLKKHQKTGEPNAEQLAAGEAADEAFQAAKKKAQQKYLKFKTTKNLFEQIRDHKTAGSGKQKPYEAGKAVFDNTGLGGLPGVYQIQREYKRRSTSMLSSFMAAQRKNILGNSSDNVQLDNFTRELFGEATGDKEAAAFAKSWKETSEWLRQEFNRAGGDIPYRQDWGLPQWHDWQAVRKSHFPAWREALYNKLDLDRMSEMYEMTPDEIYKALEGVYENIASNGTKAIDFDGMAFKKATANKRMDSRFLIFKSADDWMAYQEIFGNGDVYSILMGHIDNMTRDIALMKKLGPNPQNGLEVVKQTVRKFATEQGDKNDYDEPLQDLFEVITGAANMPVNAKFAKTMANTRQVLTGAQLGSAVVSAVTDPFFSSITSSFNGLSAAKVIGRVMKSLDGASHEEMVRIGLNAESWADAAADMARYHDEALSSPFFQRLTSGILRASGLNYWTDLWRWGFERELLGFISDNTGKAFGELDPNLERALARYGITSDEWDIIRATDQYDLGGSKILRTQDIARRTDIGRQQADDLSLKLAGFIDNESNFAVPTASLRGKRLFGTLGKPGTFWGEVLRSGMMYKSFPITLIMTHLRRSLDEAMQGRVGYVTTFMLGTTLMGALALQLKSLKDGKTPEDMQSKEFLARAIIQGGGLGIFGDFLIQDYTRYGNSLAGTLGGPVVGLAEDTHEIATLLGASIFLSEDEAIRNLYKAAARSSNYVPGRSLWYGAAAYKRGFQDNLKAMGNKRPQRKLRRMVKDLKSKRGNEFWWEPGEATPF